jgi:molecular chaperone GrpE
MVAAESDPGPVTFWRNPMAPKPIDRVDYGANMTEPVEQQARDLQSPLEQLVERVEDLSRMIARQAATIERLADEAKARAKQDRAGADLPLVVELFALHCDTAACATTAESPRECDAFEAVTTRIERLIVGRGGALVTPRQNDTFDSLTMEAADVAKTDDPDLDRTVDDLIQPGLTVSGRSVRPASVVVRRYKAPSSSAAAPKTAAQPHDGTRPTG